MILVLFGRNWPSTKLLGPTEFVYMISSSNALIYIYMIYLEYLQIIHPSIGVFVCVHFKWMKKKNAWYRRAFNTFTFVCVTNANKTAFQKHHPNQFNPIQPNSIENYTKKLSQIRMLLIIWLHAQNVIARREREKTREWACCFVYTKTHSNRTSEWDAAKFCSHSLPYARWLFCYDIHSHSPTSAHHRVILG